MAKADKLALGATTFCIGVLAGTYLENFYGYLIALVIGSFLFWRISTVSSLIISIVMLPCMLGMIHGSMHGIDTRFAPKESPSSIRNTLTHHLYAALPADEAALGAGIILGDQSGFSTTFKQAMRLSGTTHLVALSGYNIAILIAAVERIIRGRIRRTYVFWVCAGVIFLFVGIVGAQASIVRAAIMGTLILFAKYNGRIPTFRTCIAVTGMLMLAKDPGIIRWDIGFQLSFLSFIGIVYLLPTLMHWIEILREVRPSGFSEQVLAGVAAQIMVLPLIVHVFKAASLAGIFATLAITYTMPLAMATAFCTIILGLIHPILGTLGGWFAYPVLWYEVSIIYLFSHISIPFPSFIGDWIPILIYYAMLGVFFYRYYPRESFVYKHAKT